MKKGKIILVSILSLIVIYGCYYSPEDIPFSFQNITDTLTEDGKNRWEWQSDEHNGYTSKIFDNWYYFKADY